MKAAEARKLKVGDWVVACFGGRGIRKNCEITAIAWPEFTLRTADHRGDEMIRTRLYQSLHGTCEPCRPSHAANNSPGWLIWPNTTTEGDR